MIRSLLFTCFLAGALLSGPQAKADDVCASATNLVQNCGFETGNFSGWTVSGDTANAGVDTQDAYTGRFGAYLAGFGSFNSGDTNFTDVGQTLDTTPGTAYTLRFNWAHFANTDVIPDNYFSAYIDGNRVFQTTQIFIANQNYTYALPYRFVATSAATSLDFLAEDANFFFSLDDVSVTATPEPASLWLVAPILLGFYLIRRHRQAGVLKG